MQKKRKITEMWEASSKALKSERVVIRVKGRLYNVTNEKESNSIGAEPNLSKIRKIMKKEGVNSYTEIHQHPYSEDSPIQIYGSIPSPKDFFGFLINDNVKTMIISQQNRNTGEIGGHYVFRKTRKTKKSDFRMTDYGREELFDAKKSEEIFRSNPYLSEIASDVRSYEKAIGSFGTTYPKGRKEAMEEMAKKYHLKVKFIPEPEYKFKDGTGFFKEGLESKVGAFIGISGILASIFFLSSNLTGNVISNMTNLTSNLIGGILFIIGIAGAFFYFRKRR